MYNYTTTYDKLVVTIHRIDKRKQKRIITNFTKLGLLCGINNSIYSIIDKYCSTEHSTCCLYRDIQNLLNLSITLYLKEIKTSFYIITHALESDVFKKIMNTFRVNLPLINYSRLCDTVNIVKNAIQNNGYLNPSNLITLSANVDSVLGNMSVYVNKTPLDSYIFLNTILMDCVIDPTHASVETTPSSVTTHMLLSTKISTSSLWEKIPIRNINNTICNYNKHFLEPCYFKKKSNKGSGISSDNYA